MKSSVLGAMSFLVLLFQCENLDQEMVPRGQWASEEAELVTFEDGANISFFCSSLQLNEEIVTNKDFKFEVDASYFQSSGAPIDDPEFIKAKPARAYGSYYRGKLSLYYYLLSDKVLHGPYDFIYGKSILLARCP